MQVLQKIKTNIKFWVSIFCSSNVMMACISNKEFSCIPQNETCKYLYLDGTDQTLIENSLRCFELDSAASVNDSLIRIWSLELNFPDTPSKYRVTVFEIGVASVNHYAKYYTLTWGVEKDSLLRVKCVTKDKLMPKNGWNLLKEKIANLQIPL